MRSIRGTQNLARSTARPTTVQYQRNQSSLRSRSHVQAVGIEQKKTPLPEVNPLVAQGRPDNCISSLRPTRPCVWDATVSLHTARRTLALPLGRPGELGAQHTVRTRQDGVWAGVEKVRTT